MSVRKTQEGGWIVLAFSSFKLSPESRFWWILESGTMFRALCSGYERDREREKKETQAIILVPSTIRK